MEPEQVELGIVGLVEGSRSSERAAAESLTRRPAVHGRPDDWPASIREIQYGSLEKDIRRMWSAEWMVGAVLGVQPLHAQTQKCSWTAHISTAFIHVVH